MQAREYKSIRPRVILAAFFISIGLYGCGGPLHSINYNEAGEPAYGDSIVAGSIADATTLIPIVASDSASHDICGLIYNGLIRYDKDLNIVGELAESWDIEEDGKVIVFHLRKDVRWHDGERFSAQDVQFTYEKLIDPNVRTPYSGDFQKIESLQVLDDWTVKVTYKEPFSPALSSWGMWIMPKHILKDEDLNTTKHSRAPIGTGPYKFLRWRTGERIDLIANDDYFVVWNFKSGTTENRCGNPPRQGAKVIAEGDFLVRRPYIDRYIYRIIPDSAAMFIELQAEGIDMMGLGPLQYHRQTDNNFFKARYNKFRYPSFGYTYLGYNLLDDKFKDKKVRQALELAVDKNELIDGVLMGLGRVCTGPFVPESWAYNKEVEPHGFDPSKAKDMLREAGWSDTNGDGWIDKNGVAFEFTILTNQGNDERKLAAEIIQHRLKEIGINVKIKIVEWSVFLTEFVNKKRFEAVLLGWGLSRDPDCYDIWHSSKTKEGEFNFISYKNDEVDRLCEEGRRIFNQDERAKIYHKIHEILYDEQPYMFLWVADSLPIVHKRFKGIEPAPAGIGYNFIDWYAPEEQRKYKS